MRILAFLPSYFSLSGDGIHERKIVKDLSLYEQVDVVAMRKLYHPRDHKNSFDNSKESLIILPFIRPIIIFELFYGFLIGSYLSLLRIVREKSYNIIYVRSNFAGIGLIFLRRFHNIPIVLKFVAFSGDQYFMLNKNIFSYTMSKILSMVEKIVTLTSDKIIVPSSIFKIEMMRCYNIHKFKIEVLSVGVDIREFSTSVKSEDSNRYFTIGYFGSLSLLNDVDCLLKATYLLISEIKNIRVLVVTQSNTSKFIKKAKRLNIKDAIDFRNAVHKEIPKLMDYVDLIVVPRRILSSTEMVIPLKLLEAGAAKKPVIVSRSKIMEYALKNMENVLMYEPENPEDLAEKVLILYDNRELRIKISKALYNVTKSYDWKIIIKKLRDILENVSYANDHGNRDT